MRDNGLEVRTEDGLKLLERQKDGAFRVASDKAEYRARRIILATGQRGNPRKLHVQGEERERVYHRLYAPRHYKGQDILVVGGGNSAVEAALVLAEQNRVRHLLPVDFLLPDSRVSFSMGDEVLMGGSASGL